MAPALNPKIITKDKIVAPASKSVIHTMPDYFRKKKTEKKVPEDSKIVPKRKISKNKIIFISIFAVIIVLIIIATVIFYGNYQKTKSAETEKQKQLETEQELLRQKEEEAARIAAEQAQSTQKQQAEAELAAKRQRDEQRLRDMQNLQTALEVYFEDFNSYPNSLPKEGAMIAEGKVYLDKMPANPTPNGSDYLYNLKNDGLSYELAFTLEDSRGDLPAGLNKITAEKQITGEGRIISRKPREKETDMETKVLLSSLDSDLDGLTDLEEDMYGSNKNEFDSDMDSYSDKQELLNLYNPAGLAPIRLIDSGVVSDYYNASFNYHIYYPKNWPVKALDQTNSEVLFTSTTGEFIEVIVQANSDKLSLPEWIEKTFPEFNYDKLQKINTKEGLTGVKSYDRRTVYFVTPEHIFVITHNVGNKNEVDYGVTFEMMIKSFRLTETEEPAAVPANENAPL